MSMPAMPRARLVVVEAEFALGRFKTVFDGPATAFDPHQLLGGRPQRAPRREESHVTIGDRAADHQAPRPDTEGFAIEVGGIEIGEFEIGPIVEPRALVPSPAERRRQAFAGRARAIEAAVPETRAALAQEWNT